MAKKQVFQVVSKTKDRETLERIVDEAIIKLDTGMSEDLVKQWAKEQVKAPEPQDID